MDKLLVLFVVIVTGFIIIRHVESNFKSGSISAFEKGYSGVAVNSAEDAVIFFYEEKKATMTNTYIGEHSTSMPITYSYDPIQFQDVVAMSIKEDSIGYIVTTAYSIENKEQEYRVLIDIVSQNIYISKN